MTKKILIVDDQPVVRQGMKMFIETESEFEVCGETGNAADTIKVINEKNPDLAIVDISLEGETSGLDLIKEISKRFPNTNTLVVSMRVESLYAERALKAGAKGYIMKSEAQENILNAIQSILNGGLYLSAAMYDKIIGKLIHGKTDDTNPVDYLADREFEVFQLIGQGFSSKEIAERMNLSKNTVDSHKRNIKKKLGLKNSVELIKYSINWDLHCSK